METEDSIDYLVLYSALPEKPNSFAVKVEDQDGGHFVTYTFKMPAINFQEICKHCGQYLLQKEINANEIYHAACKKMVEATDSRNKLEEKLHRANSRGGL